MGPSSPVSLTHWTPLRFQALSDDGLEICALTARGSDESIAKQSSSASSAGPSVATPKAVSTLVSDGLKSNARSSGHTDVMPKRLQRGGHREAEKSKDGQREDERGPER